MKILIVEDDSAIVELVSLCLKVSWPDARILFTGLAGEGIELAERENPDLVILDLGLPDKSGLEVLKDVRGHSSVPVIILTVRQMEFVSRAKALLRRQRASDSGSPVSLGPFHFSASRRQVTCNGSIIKLTTTEGKMLYCLAQNSGKPVSHNDLSMSIWGEVPQDAANSIRVHMRNLRQKLGTVDMQSAIATKSGTGYFLKK